MKSSKAVLAAAAVAVLVTSVARAAHVDMSDPKRALGREDDVRVDAQLATDNIGSNTPISVTYQIENLTGHSVAVADRVSDISYDTDSQTLTLSIGSEVPANGTMPHLTIVNPGEKRVLTSGAVAHVNVPSVRTPFTAVPRYVQVKVNILRDITPFEKLIAQQKDPAVSNRVQALSDAQFEQWIESSDAIFLNSIPVRWNAGRPSAVEASYAAPVGGSF